ncbi:hypothetical protein DQ04_02021040 [Trypanosoma grayi]|uniref:hypothetical protein n=1 Tax=Trypanosoma grayi TaxID=71804 RepID=UPI0004F402C2|nr:hypothetical protein DQ04_02021040 [Trypanosoma grayi]KEG12078.1 hypothetical protein DQ04_02021040 [Trypanosoma grayi]
MSIVALFVSECARNGRWVRGLLALQGSVHSEDVGIAKARINLASMMVEKNWCTALALVRSTDVSHQDELGHFLYVCSKSTCIPSTIANDVTVAMLQSAKGNSEAQNRLFDFVIRWTTWHQALRFFHLIESPDKTSKKKLSEWLMFSRMFAGSRQKDNIDSALMRLNMPEVSHTNMTKWNQWMIKQTVPATQKPSWQSSGSVKALAALNSGEPLSITSVIYLAKAALRGERISWKLSLSLVAGNRVVEESSDVFAKVVGICCPQLWHVALERFHVEEKLALWLASCHSWRAALMLSHKLSLPSCEKYDILSRCATPVPFLRKLNAVSGATQRIREPTKKAIASMLASGYVLEELQLSAFARVCQRDGDWESALYLLDRIGTEEFHRRAITCLLQHHPSIKVKNVLRLVSDRNPATTSTASMLMGHSSGWMEALHVLRHVMAQGTKCNPQILSALLDKRPPPDVLSVVVANLKGATNDGILRRLKRLEEDGKKPSKQ